MVSQRKTAVDALLSVGENYGYSNIVLANIFAKNNIKDTDKPFITALFYGVLDRKITLDYAISQFVKKPLSKIAPITVTALRIAAYQIMFMDKVPNSAAVNESVNIVKNSKEKYNTAFVNAVLRNFIRRGVTLPEDKSVKSLSVKYSCPEWIIESLLSDYGIEKALSVLEYYLTVPDITVRVNNTLISDEEFIEALNKNGIKAISCDILHAVTICEGIDIKNLDLYKKGYFHVQDLPSQISVSKLNVKPEYRVLDMCASPGGKSFTAAESAVNKAKIVSCDFYENRVKLIRDGAERLRLKNIECIVCDSREFNSLLGTFDAVICDVPCSGLGVIRRKPEIKYKTDLDFDELKITQTAILNNALKYLKPGGRLLYSTCTLRRAENDCIVRDCLDKNSGYELEYEHTFFPDTDNTDGFYCAVIKSR